MLLPSSSATLQGLVVLQHPISLTPAWNTSITTPRDWVLKHQARVQHSARPWHFAARAALRMSYTGSWGPAAVKALMSPANSGPSAPLHTIMLQVPSLPEAAVGKADTMLNTPHLLVALVQVAAPLWLSFSICKVEMMLLTSFANYYYIYWWKNPNLDTYVLLLTNKRHFTNAFMCDSKKAQFCNLLKLNTIKTDTTDTT